MFKIEFENKKNEKEFAHQTSWGLTTRSIGIMTMFHGDDKGLVLPPRVASTQVVIVPIPFKDQEEMVMKHAEELYTVLKKGGIRVTFDDKTNYNPGWKFNYWELRGVPVRLELGPKDIKAGEVKCVVRVDGKKFQLKLENIVEALKMLLEDIQAQMFTNAKNKLL